MKKICWITEAWAFDTDKGIVPYLIKKKEYDIKWYILCKETDTSIKESTNYTIIKIPYRYRDPRNIFYYYKIFDRIRIKKYDVIYSSALGMPYYYPILFLQKGSKQPLIHAAHNVIPYPVWPTSLKWYVRYIFHYNNHFQLFSKFTIQYFKEHYPKKSMFYAPMTIKDLGAVTTNKYNLDENKVNLLFFGNVIENKRLDLLIDAIKSLPPNIQERVHLNICGRCNDSERYIKQINDCKVISTYFKRIDDCEIAELFTKHSFLMLPYQDVAQSGPHMIAYNYNLPVIASDINGFAERVEDGKNGFLFRRNDVESLRQTIIKAVNLSNYEYAVMKENLKKYTAENFSVEVVAKKYVDYFNSI